MADEAPLIGIIMGSRSDWETMRHAAEMLDALGVSYEQRVVSAHRTPDRLYAYAKGAAGRGLKVIIAGAGGAAHLPGMAASMTRLPVLGVQSDQDLVRPRQPAFDRPDARRRAGRQPCLGKAGATNSGLLAAAILATADAGWGHGSRNGGRTRPTASPAARMTEPDDRSARLTIGIIDGGQWAMAAAQLGYVCTSTRLTSRRRPRR
jgi:5-(carboxyamino)imidazole ribonucleotide mutase